MLANLVNHRCELGHYETGLREWGMEDELLSVWGQSNCILQNNVRRSHEKDPRSENALNDNCLLSIADLQRLSALSLVTTSFFAFA